MEITRSGRGKIRDRTCAGEALAIRDKKIAWPISLMLFALASPLYADQADWGKLVEAANHEGRVTVYSTQPPEQTLRAKEASEKRYPGIQVTFARMTSTALVAKVEQESSSGVDGGDVIIYGELPWLQKQADGGNLHPYSGPALADFPKEALKSHSIAIVSIDPLGLAYNTGLVPRRRVSPTYWTRATRIASVSATSCRRI